MSAPTALCETRRGGTSAVSTGSTGKPVLPGLLPVPLPLETEATFHKRKWYPEVAAEVASGSTARVAGTSGH